MKTTIYFMKKIVAIGFAMLAGGISVTAQNDNTKMALPEFNAVVVSTNGDIKLNQGTENSVSVKTGNVQDAVSAEVKDNVLYLRKGNDDITVNFTKLNKITLQSSCDVKSIDQISSDKLEVFILGSSDINLDVNVKELNTTIEGSGDAKYIGTADSHTVVVKGSGDLDAYDLSTASTNIEISGSGEARVNASQDLKGVINGAGEITYFKEPANKDIKVHGVGSYGVKGGKEESKGGDTTKIKIANKKVWIMDDNGNRDDSAKHKHKFDVYWAGFGLGINGYLNANNGTTVPKGFNLDYAKSIDVTCNFWEQKIPIWKRHINIVTGMGFDFDNYRFGNNYTLVKGSSQVAAVYDSAVTFKKNKLMLAYLNVPLLLQFDTDPIGRHNHTIHLSAGVVGGLRIGAHTKQEYEISGTNYSPKVHDDFDLNPFKCSAMVRVGYGNLDLYASYALTSMFQKNEGPQLYPFSVGITIIGL
jgi:hypothetical protein